MVSMRKRYMVVKTFILSSVAEITSLKILIGLFGNGSTTCKACHEDSTDSTDSNVNDCECMLGYTGNGETCSDVNECTTANSNNCDEEVNLTYECV